MSQFTHTQKAAALLILNKATTVSEFTNKFNITFGTKHDEFDITSLLHEFELSDIVKRSGIRLSGETVFIPMDSRIFGEQVWMLKKAIEVEQSHIRAYWAGH